MNGEPQTFGRVRAMTFPLIVFLFVGCKSSLAPVSDRPLLSFEQEITSPIVRLRLYQSQTVELPVVIKNTGVGVWTSSGTYPIRLSYVWSSGAQLLGIEGERTVLPGAVLPGHQIPIQVRVAAPRIMVPREGCELTLAVTLVQEGVAWFSSAGGIPLQIPVELSGAPFKQPSAAFRPAGMSRPRWSRPIAKARQTPYCGKGS